MKANKNVAARGAGSSATAALTIGAVFVGRPSRLWEGKPVSAIRKIAAQGAVAAKHHGLDGDEQADLDAHGGPDKAIHHYPADHIAAWRADLGSNAAFVPGGFGENITTHGWTEEDVCIGDVLRMGEALVQISQGRQPCWKLSAHVGVEQMAYHVRKTLRTGWYYRVLEPGLIRAGDVLSLEERPWPGMTVRRVAAAFFDRRVGTAEARAMADMPELAEEWRGVFAQRT